VRKRTDQLSRKRMDRIATLSEDLMAEANEVGSQVKTLRIAIRDATKQLSDDIGLATPPPSQSTRSAAGATAGQSSASSSGARPSGGAPSPQPKESSSEDGGRFGKRWTLGKGSSPEAADGASADGAGADGGSADGGSADGGSADGEATDGARLLALQLSVAGTDEEAIERRLREDFGIADPAPIIDSLRQGAATGSV